jgi:hypothetical protein
MASKYDQWIAIAEANDPPQAFGDIPIEMFASALDAANRTMAEFGNESVRVLGQIAAMLGLPENISMDKLFEHVMKMDDDDLPDGVEDLLDEFMEKFFSGGGLDLEIAQAQGVIQMWMMSNTYPESLPAGDPTHEGDPVSLNMMGRNMTMKSQYWDFPDRVVMIAVAEANDGSWYALSAPMAMDKTTEIPDAVLTLISKAIPEWQELAEVARQLGNGFDGMAA